MIDTSRRYATQREVAELLELVHRRDNPTTRLYRSKMSNRVEVYKTVVGKDAGHQAEPDGWIYSSWSQIAYNHYPDVEVNNPADGHRKANSLRRMLDDLAKAGLIEWRPRTDARGKFVGVMVRLLPVRSWAAPVAQLDEAAGSWRRAHETRRQRRAACARGGHRRVGHGSRPLFFASSDLARPLHRGAPGLRPGALPHGCARARVGDASDAVAASSRDQANSGDERERAALRAARKARRRSQRLERWHNETWQQIADGDRIHRDELATYAAADGDTAAQAELYGRFAAFLPPDREGDG